jgi:mannose-6-phosphate isomerase-like protein (cupin superfamily)
MEYLIVDQNELPVVGGARVCEGEGESGSSISMIFVDVPRGGGPRLHRHPYNEIFVVHEGHARFTVGTTSIDAPSGKIVTVAAGIPHKFINSGEGRLVQTDIHLSSRLETEWLEPECNAEPKARVQILTDR